jgi:hypothetical protein
MAQFETSQKGLEKTTKEVSDFITNIMRIMWIITIICG